MQPIPLQIQLDSPIGSVSLMNAGTDGTVPVDSTPSPKETMHHIAETDKQKENELHHLCQALSDALAQIEQLEHTIFSSHNEHIAKLATEIAAKILSRKIEEGDYNIQAIIRDALQTAPKSNETTIHLNPTDCETILTLKENGSDDFEGIQFVADPTVQRAECIIETDLGIVRSLIEEHLSKIEEALKEAAV